MYFELQKFQSRLKTKNSENIWKQISQNISSREMRFSHGAQTSYIYFKRIFEKIAFHISFQILSPIRRRSNTILWIFLSIKGGEDDIFFLQIFCLLLDFFIFLSVYFCAWRWHFSLQNFYLRLDFCVFFFCLQMIFCPFRISASCWISSFYYPDIFVPEDDIFSLHNLCLLLEFLLTRNQQTFVHQSEEGGGYSDFHARFHPNTSYRL